MDEQERRETYWARDKEAERFITSIKGPRPEPTEIRDSILGAMAGEGWGCVDDARTGARRRLRG